MLAFARPRNEDAFWVNNGKRNLQMTAASLKQLLILKPEAKIDTSDGNTQAVTTAMVRIPAIGIARSGEILRGLQRAGDTPGFWVEIVIDNPVSKIGLDGVTLLLIKPELVILDGVEGRVIR